MFEKWAYRFSVSENMNVHICSNCGHAEPILAKAVAKMANRFVAFGSLPLDISIRTNADSGHPTGRRAGQQAGADLQGRAARWQPDWLSKRRITVRASHGDHQRLAWASNRTADPPWWEYGMIEPTSPASEGSREFRVISYGTELRLRYPVLERVHIFTNINSAIVDPKNFDENSFVDVTSDVCIIAQLFAWREPSNVSDSTRRADHLPRNRLTPAAELSSTSRLWNRSGGHDSRVFNTTPLPAKIYANEGVAQVLFIGADEICEVSYKDRGGKYRDNRRDPA